LFRLHVSAAQKIPGVSISGVDFGYALERIDGCLRVSGVFGEESKVVPGVRIFGILLERLFECSFRLLNLLQIQVSDAFVEARDGEFGVEFRGLLKFF
jgi:hypothetical protein